jgi:hypothetical protein
MHEYHFSLNGKYRNTHFALNEEQAGLLTYITLYVAPTHTYTWRGETPSKKKMREREEEWDVSLF